MVRNDDGTLSSAMADSNGREVMDTTRYFHHAFCAVNGDRLSCDRLCDARLFHDTLQINIQELTASANDNLIILVKGKKIKADYRTSFFFHHDPQDVSWTTVKQELVLNRSDFRVGDTIKGYINFACVERWKQAHGGDDQEKNEDTICIQGPFFCVIQPAVHSSE